VGTAPFPTSAEPQVKSVRSGFAAREPPPQEEA